MNKRKLFIIMFIVMLIVACVTGSVAYYRTTVEGGLTGSSGNAVFNVTGLTDSGENKTISLGNKLLPGDSGSFNIILDSTGSTVDMYATLKIDRRVLPNNLKFYSTADHKSEISTYYSLLEVNGNLSETITIYWYWNPFKDDNDDNKYVGKNLTADISISAVQISEYATMKNGYSSDSSANGGTEFWNDNYKPYIKTINFGNDLSNLPSTCNEDNLCWDISYSSSQNKKVYGYLVDTGLKDSTDNTKPLYNLYIVSDAPIFAPSNCEKIFSFYKYENRKNISNLTQINFNDNFNTSNTTNMYLMFCGCSSLSSLDLSSFNTANVTNMTFVFRDCSSLTSLDLSGFNTTNVIDMNCMFYHCSSLTSLDLSSFNTTNVTDITDMFYDCSSLTSLDLSSFNTANVTNMKWMFAACSSLTSLDLSSFNTANVTNMEMMFHSCSSLTSLDISNFNTKNVTDMYRMFEYCSSLTSLDLSSFNTANVIEMGSMFKRCSSLTTTINIMNANVSDYSSMFFDAATASGSKITVNYIASASTLVDNMIATKSSNSNVVKGIQL